MYFKYKEYAANRETYREMINAMKQEVQDFMAVYQEDSRLLSGWGHAYFCQEDGGRLVYDPKKPYEHRCSICGKVYRDFLYNSCHVTMMRNEAVVTAVKCGVLYQLTGDRSYVWTIQSIIQYFADHYEEFALHAKEKISCNVTEDVGGAGRIMPQGLNEAIIAIRLVNAMELVKEALEEEWLEYVKKQLFTPIVNLLLPQKQHIHNIPVWINSAIGEMGLFFQESAWILEATERPYNLYEQLKKGVTESGFWYEGSIHYNFFALEGVMSYLVFAKAYDFPLPETCKETVFHMLDAAYHYAFDNDIFPNPSDGWPNIGLKTYLHVYYMAYSVFDDRLLPYIRHMEEMPGERPTLPLSEPYYYQNRISLEKLLFAADIDEKETCEAPKRHSSSFASSNCALIRNGDYNVFLKYGHQTKSHAHPDKMNVEIMVKGKMLTKDLSNSGYASKMCKEWHRNNASHNTCMVDGKTVDVTRSGELISFEENRVRAKAEAYDGVWYERELLIDGSVMTDEFVVNTETDVVIDWFFHLEDPVDRSVLELEAVSLDVFDQYDSQYLMEPMEIHCGGENLQIENELVAMTLQIPVGSAVYLLRTYNNPANTKRDTLVVRAHGKELQVKNVIKAK